MRLTSAILDRYLHFLLTTYLSPATLLPQLLCLTRQHLFPQNTLPPPAAPPPSPSQARQVKRKCAKAITAAMGPTVCKRLFGGGGGEGDDDEGEWWVRQVEGELDVWGDGWMNRHLAYRALELVVVRVLPEMGAKGVRELVEGRVGGGGGGGGGQD